MECDLVDEIGISFQLSLCPSDLGSCGAKQARKVAHGRRGSENGSYYIVYWGYIGVMEKKMETGFRLRGGDPRDC